MIIIKNKEPNKLYTGSEAQAQLLVNECAQVLLREYPHHWWKVSTSSDWSCIYIKCLNVSVNYGITLHTHVVQSDPDLKCVIRAGGEILERGFQNRGKNTGKNTTKLDLMGAANIKSSDRSSIIKDVKYGA
jgi:hypothetical protein